MMAFHVGQEIVCINAGLAVNPWHAANPLTLNNVYTVGSIEICPFFGYQLITVDASTRLWESHRFRPLQKKKLSELLEEKAPKDSAAWDNRKTKRRLPAKERA